MKITTKINLLTSIWILCVLLAVNGVVYFSFMKIAVNIEEDDVLQNAQNIIEEIKGEDSPIVLKEKLTPYLMNYSFIRIIRPDSKIVQQVTNDPVLSSKVKGQFITKLKAQRSIIRENHKEQQIIVVSLPIKFNGKIVETLEYGKKLTGLEMGKDVLLSILALCTVLGAVLSLLGGRWVSNIIMRPISNMINTMEDIEKSGIPKTIVIQHDTKDDLQKMAVTFNRMIGRLNANLDKQKQFISDASHELRTPLTVIKSYADLLLRRGLQNEDIAKDAIGSIHVEATRIQKMTERLLDLANTEIEHALDLKSLNLIALCQDILILFKRVYKREISLHYSQILIVSADEVKLKQVIIILLDNAIKYSTDKIDVYLEQNENLSIIRVQDYGIGIPKDETENIFERFYRVDKARSRETGGTGLGLSIAKNIMKQHNGEIKVSSKEGSGTEITLYLPNSLLKEVPEKC